MTASKNNSIVISEKDLFKELSQLIEQSQQQFLAQANSTLTMLFWHIGNRINENILQNKRADYGKQIVVTLSRELTKKYSSNSSRQIRRGINKNLIYEIKTNSCYYFFEYFIV